MTQASQEPKSDTPNERWIDPASGYVPFLDGLRAIAIMLVTCFHQPGVVTALIGWKFNGWVGVDVFFVISGFLITSILLKEEREKGQFSLKRFYIRRCLRIWPAYYVFLFVSMLEMLYSHDVHWGALAVCALYLSDFDVSLHWGNIDAVPRLNMTWSLAVEEQFYLLWPPLMKILKGFRLPFAAAVVVAVIIWRGWLVATGADWTRLSGGFDTKIDSILFGCIAALIWSNESTRQKVGKFMQSRAAPFLYFVLLINCWLYLGHPSYGDINDKLVFWLVKMPVHNLITALLILSLCVHPKSKVAGFLSLPFMHLIGRLSYSLYLWFFMTLLLIERVYPHSKLDLVGEAITLVTLFVFACASYYLVERPFLLLKKRFAAVPEKDHTHDHDLLVT